MAVLPLLTFQPPTWQTPTKPNPVAYTQLIKPVQQAQFPSPSSDKITASVNKVDTERAAEAAEAARVAAAEAARVAAEAQAVQMAEGVTYSLRQGVGTLTGSYGYISPLSNCVTLAVQYGKNQTGNPISWGVSTQTPFIGAAALFYFNHVGIITGIWSNGDIELAHANYSGSQTRFSRSEFRGFF